MSLYSDTTLFVIGPLTVYIKRGASEKDLINAWDNLVAVFEVYLANNHSNKPQEAPPCEAATEIHQLESCSSANAGATATNEKAAPSEENPEKS